MKVYKLRKCTRSPVPQQEEQLPSSLVKEEQGGVRTAQVDNTSPRDASAAAVEEGVHATHGEVRYEREVFYRPNFVFRFFLSMLPDRTTFY